MILNVLGQPVTSQKREIKTSNPKIAKFAAYADDVFRQLHLTVICPSCQQTPVCNNAPTDSVWRMECACAVRVLTNPDVQSRASGVRH